MKPVPKPEIEVIIDMIIEGDNYRTICQKTGMKLSTLADFLAQEANIPRVRVALDISANVHAAKAEEVLLNAPSTLVEISRARELASHYRWMAAKRSPKTFSDKQQIDLTTTNKTIKVKTPNSTPDTEQTTD
jgi:hypothetical protein